MFRPWLPGARLLLRGSNVGEQRPSRMASRAGSSKFLLLNSRKRRGSVSITVRGIRLAVAIGYAYMRVLSRTAELMLLAGVMIRNALLDLVNPQCSRTDSHGARRDAPQLQPFHQFELEIECGGLRSMSRDVISSLLSPSHPNPCPTDEP